VLRQGIQGVSELIVKPSLINLDFADVNTIMKDKGLAHMGIGRGRGQYKTMEAVRQAVTSQLLETSIEGATGILIDITGGRDLSLAEIYEAVDLVRDVVDSECNIIFGASIDENIKDEVQVTVIATGFDMKDQPKPQAPEMPKVENIMPEINTNFVNNSTTLEQTIEEDEEELEEVEQKAEPVQDISFNSKIDLGDTSIPPFLRKLKK